MSIKENTMITDWLYKHGCSHIEYQVHCQLWQLNYMYDRLEYMLDNLHKLKIK